jgi:hypothetical protein
MCVEKGGRGGGGGTNASTIADALPGETPGIETLQ